MHFDSWCLLKSLVVAEMHLYFMHYLWCMICGDLRLECGPLLLFKLVQTGLLSRLLPVYWC